MKQLVNRIKLVIAGSILGRFLRPVYAIRYRPESNGRREREVVQYLISRPFDKFHGGITAYAFDKGIRSFRLDRIESQEIISLW